MPRCRKCGKDWPSQYRVCPDDGSPLGVAEKTKQIASTPPPPAAQNEVPPALAEPASVSPEAGADLAHGMMVADYRIEGKLGEGGMGAVYSAIHPLIGKKAAIKVISAALCSDSSAVERFVQEARSVNQIGHPNIVDVFAFDELSDGRSYFIMEWLQGEGLGERIARGRMELAEAVEILDQVCDALEAAHEKGIVHRDLKPDNVFLVAVRGGRQLVKLLDFGIAKLAGSGDTRLQKTRTGIMMGTPGYISPEQARGKNVDHRTDVYALGAMSYEMVLGRLPFEADNAMDIVMKHLTEEPPEPTTLWPEVPPKLGQVLQAMLAKDPAQRPPLPAFRAVLAEVRGLMLATAGPQGSAGFSSFFAPRIATPPAGVPVLASANPVPSPHGQEADEPEPPPRRSWKGVSVFAAAFAIVGVAAVVVMGGSKDTPADKAHVAPSAAPEKPAQAAPPPRDTISQPPTPAPAPAPVPAPAQESKTGVVVVTADADDAQLELDGKVVAATAARSGIEVEADREHMLVITAKGRKPYRAPVVVKAGATATHNVTLERSTRVNTTVSKPQPAPATDKPAPKKPPPAGCADCLTDPFGNQ